MVHLVCSSIWLIQLGVKEETPPKNDFRGVFVGKKGKLKLPVVYNYLLRYTLCGSF